MWHPVLPLSVLWFHQPSSVLGGWLEPGGEAITWDSLVIQHRSAPCPDSKPKVQSAGVDWKPSNCQIDLSKDSLAHRSFSWLLLNWLLRNGHQILEHCCSYPCWYIAEALLILSSLGELKIPSHHTTASSSCCTGTP